MTHQEYVSFPWHSDDDAEEFDGLFEQVKLLLAPYYENVDEFYKWDRDYIEWVPLPKDACVARVLHQYFMNIMTQARVLLQCVHYQEIREESQVLAEAMFQFEELLRNSTVPQGGRLKTHRQLLYLELPSQLTVARTLLFCIRSLCLKTDSY